jgi:hypothetical protein
VRCKRPARAFFDHTLPSGRDVSKTRGLADAALAASEKAFPASWLEEGEEDMPFSDVPAELGSDEPPPSHDGAPKEDET